MKKINIFDISDCEELNNKTVNYKGVLDLSGMLVGDEYVIKDEDVLSLVDKIYWHNGKPIRDLCGGTYSVVSASSNMMKYLICKQLKKSKSKYIFIDDEEYYNKYKHNMPPMVKFCKEDRCLYVY